MQESALVITGKALRTLKTIPLLLLTLILALALALVLSAAIPVSADTAGPRDAGTGANVTGIGTIAWADPGNITAVGAPYATATSVPALGGATNYLEGTNYGFSIPAGATISGISVTINRQSTGIISPFLRDNVVSLVKGGSLAGTNKAATTTDWPTAGLGTATYGGPSDLWGTTWTAADINAGEFGVALSAINNNPYDGLARDATVDYMKITVTYAPNYDTTTTVSSSLNPSRYGDSVTFTAMVVRSGGAATPTGTVDFQDGGVSIGAGTLRDIGGGAARAALVTSFLDTGGHAITAVYGGDSNFSSSTGTLAGGQTVNTLAITVTTDPGQTKVYGDADPVFTYTNDPLVGGDSFSGALIRDAGEDVGGYAINQGTLAIDDGYGGNNYDLTFVSGQLEITARQLNITGIVGANKVYDGTTDATVDYSGAVLIGVIAPDDVGWDSSSLVATFDTKNVGSSKTVTAAGLILTGADAGNYYLVDPTTTANVSQTDLTITAKRSTKTYDGNTSAAAVPSVVGLQPADTLTGLTETYDNRDVGTYKTLSVATYTVNDGNGGNNYNVILITNTTGVISQASLTITANSTTKTYGDTVAFAGTEFTATGLVGGDTVTSVTLTSAGAAASAMVAGGPYAIAPSAATGTGLDNYAITYVNGALTLNKASIGLDLTCSSTTTKPGRSVTLTATAAGTGATGTVTFKDGETALGNSSLINGAATYTTSTLSVGSHSVTAVYSGDADFAGSTSPAVDLTVERAARGDWGLIGGIIAALLVGLFFLLLLIYRRRSKPKQQAQT